MHVSESNAQSNLRVNGTYYILIVQFKQTWSPLSNTVKLVTEGFSLLWSCMYCYSFNPGLDHYRNFLMGTAPSRAQCKHGTDTRLIVFVKDIQWKQGRERALHPWQGTYIMAYGVCTGHTSGSWDNCECLSSFQPPPCIHTCIQYIREVHTTVYIHIARTCMHIHAFNDLKCTWIQTVRLQIHR